MGPIQLRLTLEACDANQDSFTFPWASALVSDALLSATPTVCTTRNNVVGTADAQLITSWMSIPALPSPRGIDTQTLSSDSLNSYCGRRGCSGVFVMQCHHRNGTYNNSACVLRGCHISHIVVDLQLPPSSTTSNSQANVLIHVSPVAVRLVPFTIHRSIIDALVARAQTFADRGGRPGVTAVMPLHANDDEGDVGMLGEATGVKVLSAMGLPIAATSSSGVALLAADGWPTVHVTHVCRSFPAALLAAAFHSEVPCQDGRSVKAACSSELQHLATIMSLLSIDRPISTGLLSDDDGAAPASAAVRHQLLCNFYREMTLLPSSLPGSPATWWWCVVRYPDGVPCCFTDVAQLNAQFSPFIIPSSILFHNAAELPPSSLLQSTQGRTAADDDDGDSVGRWVSAITTAAPKMVRVVASSGGGGIEEKGGSGMRTRPLTVNRVHNTVVSTTTSATNSVTLQAARPPQQPLSRSVRVLPLRQHKSQSPSTHLPVAPTQLGLQCTESAFSGDLTPAPQNHNHHYVATSDSQTSTLADVHITELNAGTISPTVRLDAHSIDRLDVDVGVEDATHDATVASGHSTVAIAQSVPLKKPQAKRAAPRRAKNTAAATAHDGSIAELVANTRNGGTGDDDALGDAPKQQRKPTKRPRQPHTNEDLAAETETVEQRPRQPSRRSRGAHGTCAVNVSDLDSTTATPAAQSSCAPAQPPQPKDVFAPAAADAPPSIVG